MKNSNWMKKALGLLAVGAVVVVAAAPDAEALGNGTLSMGPVTITANTGLACAIVSNFTAVSVNYANVAVTSPESTAVVNCQGLAAAGDPATLQFTSSNGSYKLQGQAPGNNGTLAYTVCQDPGCGTLFAYNTVGALPSNLLNGNNTVGFYFHLAAGLPAVAADNYSDALSATLAY